jgi:PAS domain S-box-containing protein
VNQQNYSSAFGAGLGVSGGTPLVAHVNGLGTGSDEAFRKLLFRVAANASDETDPSTLARSFCRIHGTPDVATIIAAVADPVRVLLHAPLVCVLQGREGAFELKAVSAENSQLATSARARHDRKTLRFGADLARRALAVGEPITLSVGADVHSLGNLVSPGMLIAAPFRTSRTECVILIYPRADEIFSVAERALVGKIAAFIAIALAQAELPAGEEAQDRAVLQLPGAPPEVESVYISQPNSNRADSLLRLSHELVSSLRLPEFAPRFVARAATLLNAPAALLAVPHEGHWQLAAIYQAPSSSNEAATLSPSVPNREIERALSLSLGEFVSNHGEGIVSRPAEQILGPEAAASFGWKHCTLLQLRNATGGIAGLLCLTGQNLGDDNRPVLEGLAAQAGMVLENSRQFTHLEQENRQWTEIFDAITDFIVVHDAVDRVLRVNRSLAEMIGVPASELVGVNMRALMALTSESNSHSCPFCRSSTDDVDELAHPVLDRTYLVSTSRLQGPGGEGMQTIHVLKDISDRREAERRYRELFDNIQEGLFFSTPAGRFIEVNDAMVRMLGYGKREELLQVDIPTQLYFSPEHLQHQMKVMEEQGALRNFEATLRRKDDSPIHVLINAFGLYDNAGELLQIRGLMLDITGLRASQSELHRERDFSAKILSNTQSLILVADTAGLISYGNQRCYDAGFDEKELVGRPLLELAAPGFVRPLAEAVQHTLDGQQVDNLELEIVRRSGASGKFSANLSPMRDESGNVTSIVLVLTDITDAAVLRDKLVHAEKMAAVGQLVSGVAHEVNNPLTAILGFADLLLESPDLPATARKDLRVILQEAQRTKQIVQNLLSFARQMPPQRSPVQLNPILRRTIQLRSYDLNSHGIEVTEHLDEGLPDVMGDAHQLQQVFLNILNNAYDAVHEVGRPARIQITSVRTGDSVEVSFTDNGKGISHPDKIFDPFFTTKEIGKGTGLGLSICYGIVQEHGGEILCHNNVAGQGATFIVRLPATHPTSFGVAAGVTQP